MPIMRVRNVGSKGVIKDLPSFDLPAEAWSDSNNVRFIANRIEKIGGFFPVLVDNMPDDAPLAVLSRNNTQDQIYATKDSIYLVNGRNHYNVSKMHTDSGGVEVAYKYQALPESTWYYTTLSNSIVMTTPLDNPQGLTPGNAHFADLPGWGKPSKNNPDQTIDWKAGRVRAFKNYLVALDLNEAGVEYPQRVRWSDISFVNSLPTNWYQDSETNDGGFNDLSDANGKIVDGLPLRDSFVIYTNQETYLMEYVGGVNIFQFKKLFSTSGLLAPECVAEFEQKHFFITKDDIFVHNGSSKEPVASGRVKQFLIDEISSTNPHATKVFAYTPKKEIWITYVGPGQGSDSNVDLEWTCNKCAIWNWEWDTWYFTDIPPSFDINLAPPPDVVTMEWEEFSEDDDYWDSSKWKDEQWTILGKDFVRRIPYIASADKVLYTIDTGEDQVRMVGGVETRRPVVAHMTRTHLDMDEMVESIRSHKFIKHITPQFRGNGQIHCYVGGSFNPTQDPTWDNYQIFDIEEDVKIDAFSNNRYPAVRYVDFDKGSWSFQGYDIDFVVEGIR
ncbi:MAG: hypothetical protein ACRC6V_15140 [Bacteroidales bacterium]